MESIVKGNYKLVICPDGGSADIDCHNILRDCGIDVVVLDHHQAPFDEIKEESSAIVVNVQGCEYPNKFLSGAGVVQRFIEGYDELYCGGKIDTDYWLDLAALGNAADMMDYREFETRALINLGFTEIHNPFIKALKEKNAYIIEKRNGMNYLSSSFGISPFINAITRSAEPEEKEFVFNAMLDRNADKMAASTKRGHKGELVPFPEEAVLVADRVKRRQTDLQAQAMELLEQKMEEEHLNDNAVLTFFCEKGQIPPSIAGLACNLVQAKYQKPALVLNYHPDEDAYIGSGRNYSLSPLQDFKTVLEETGEVEWAAGHSGAFGTEVKASKVQKLIEALNKRYAGIDQTPVYWVDYVWDSITIDPKTILDIGSMNIFGQGVQESKVAVEKIPLSESNVILMSRDKNPTLKIKCGDVDIIKFHSSEKEFNDFISRNKTLTVVGKPSVNEWQGNISAQILADDFILEDVEEHELSWEDF